MLTLVISYQLMTAGEYHFKTMKVWNISHWLGLCIYQLLHIHYIRFLSWRPIEVRNACIRGMSDAPFLLNFVLRIIQVDQMITGTTLPALLCFKHNPNFI